MINIMNLSNELINQITLETNYVFGHYYDDEQVNAYFNYFTMILKNEDYFINNNSLNLDDVLYEEYFWYTKFKNEFTRKYNNDEGINQQQYKLLEDLDKRLSTGIDWNMIKDIEKAAL